MRLPGLRRRLMSSHSREFRIYTSFDLHHPANSSIISNNFMMDFSNTFFNTPDLTVVLSEITPSRSTLRTREKRARRQMNNTEPEHEYVTLVLPSVVANINMNEVNLNADTMHTVVSSLSRPITQTTTSKIIYSLSRIMFTIPSPREVYACQYD